MRSGRRSRRKPWLGPTHTHTHTHTHTVEQPHAPPQSTLDASPRSAARPDGLAHWEVRYAKVQASPVRASRVLRGSTIRYEPPRRRGQEGKEGRVKSLGMPRRHHDGISARTRLTRLQPYVATWPRLQPYVATWPRLQPCSTSCAAEGCGFSRHPDEQPCNGNVTAM